MRSPGLFSDIGKKAKDLLTKDYTCDREVTLSTVTASGVCLTSTAVKKGGLYSLDISSMYQHKNALICFKVDAESNVSTTFNVLGVLPSTKLAISVKLPDCNASKISTAFIISEALPYRKLVVSVKLPDDPLKLKLQYFHENATFATVVRMKPSPMVEFSATVGTEGVAFGAECRYDAARGKFRNYRAAIGMTSKYYHAALIMADKGDTIKVYGLYHFDKKQVVSAVVELTRKLSKKENTLTVGGLYTVDAQTTVKARLNDSGSLAALLRLQVKPKSHLMISGEFDMKSLDKPPKIGLALALVP
ncbi:hypothetical protein GQ55_9G352900 [Panicum hallii var. hallii]|uniref:Mitochondrial outer membrane protein porin 5 n=2 Tax=Panicum hallii var. hallii TaxID=1504633 RepID=A0A2T7C8M5_9POAL|nr:hypothetical protein GQ55_9G352900 [Panicum hallii var. hallii]